MDVDLMLKLGALALVAAWSCSPHGLVHEWHLNVLMDKLGL